jgi:hypothetical protein
MYLENKDKSSLSRKWNLRLSNEEMDGFELKVFDKVYFVHGYNEVDSGVITGVKVDRSMGLGDYWTYEVFVVNRLTSDNDDTIELSCVFTDVNKAEEAVYRRLQEGYVSMVERYKSQFKRIRDEDRDNKG